MRLLLDAHISPSRIAAPLRAGGHDVRAVGAERELDGVTDEALLELAAREKRALVTFDVADFPELARRWADEGRRHAGLAIVVGIDHGEFKLVVSVVEAALRARPQPDHWRNLTVFLDRRLAES